MAFPCAMVTSVCVLVKITGFDDGTFTVNMNTQVDAIFKVRKVAAIILMHQMITILLGIFM
jgi:hypothetical protein